MICKGVGLICMLGCVDSYSTHWMDVCGCDARCNYNYEVHMCHVCVCVYVCVCVLSNAR